MNCIWRTSSEDATVDLWYDGDDPAGPSTASGATDASGIVTLDLPNCQALVVGRIGCWDRLTPVERAVVVLRDAFGWPFAAIAEMVQKSEANCRQIHRRAGSRIAAIGDSPVRFGGADSRAEHLVLALLWASKTGDEATLGRLLAEDATLVSDGGGVVFAAGRVLRGAASVARTLIGITAAAPTDTSITLETVTASARCWCGSANA